MSKVEEVLQARLELMQQIVEELQGSLEQTEQGKKVEVKKLRGDEATSCLVELFTPCFKVEVKHLCGKLGSSITAIVCRRSAMKSRQ